MITDIDTPHNQADNPPRIIFSAINGGSGKTFITTGIIAALRARGLTVQTFKKGPDYIDVKWHSLASGRAGYNLDLFLFKEEVIPSLLKHSTKADISIIEGNHGLYDSIDPEGTGSTAYLARYLSAPVILIVNCHKMSRSVAALVNGFVNFEKETNIAGVILNQVTGTRHEEKIREAIKHHCLVPVLGVVYKSKQVNLEQRHLGIITTEDKPEANTVIAELQKIAERSIDLDQIMETAKKTAPLSSSENTKSKSKVTSTHKNSTFDHITLAVARDAAFNFYYPDNLEALEEAGADIIYFSPISDNTVPTCDGIYIGGGYPEFYASELEKNLEMRQKLATLINDGIPVFAECGGMMYMTQKIIWDDKENEMVGLLPAISVMRKKPQGKGYVELKMNDLKINTENNEPGYNSFWEVQFDENTRAHEFHYSVLENLPANIKFIFSVNRGSGIINNLDGILFKNMVATYTHFHALAAPWWAPAFVKACIKYKQIRSS